MVLGNLEKQILGGRYQIESLIGQGGMAAVYKAYDPNLRRTVAIKIIHTHLSNNADFVRRFEEEATAVARLRHPNIVQVFDFNHDNDLYYMVMEFIAGETLQSRLKRMNEAGRHLAVKDAIRFTQDTCEAADYAHQRGMIHRDIKPANVMLDVNGKAILMDFGIARIVGGQQHTATGAVIGTALYMAPEQIQGLHADARADIYSLGVMLFEILSGRPPFEADSAMTVMMMHLNDPVPDIRQIQPEAPASLVAVIERATAKNRDERFQSAAEMAAALRNASSQPDIAAQAIKPAAKPATAQVAGATLVEAALTPPPDSTMIEQAGSGVKPTSQAKPASGETIIERQPVQQSGQPSRSPAASAFPASSDQAAYPVQRKGGKTWIYILAALLVLAIGAGGFFAYQTFFNGSDPNLAVAPLPTQTNPAVAALPVNQPSPTPTATPQATATQTQEPSPTPTETATPTPAPITIGGADKIAFLSGSNIWAANLDGSELTQLTQDGTAKKYLRWLPDGQGLSYISGKCIQTVSLQGELGTITCFNNAEFLDSFEVSPDGRQVAISLDRQIYLLPFDLQAIQGADTHGELAAIATCTGLAPYQRNFGYSVRWSRDATQWAALIMGVLKDGRRGDLVQVFNVDQCIPNPQIAIQFPPPHFTFGGYEDNPTLENIAWDGDSLFSFHGNTRNEGFGDLHVFNMESYQYIDSINPVGGVCCYRDPQWSPDGTHLLFAFQDYAQGSSSTTQLYYIPYGSIGTGASYEPLPLPEISDPREKPQPVLRPAESP
jgi:serine/threonine-protein kinase